MFDGIVFWRTDQNANVMKNAILICLLIFTSICVSGQDKGFYLKPSGSYFLKVTPVEFPNVGTLQPRNVEGYLVPPSAENSSVTQVTTSTETITGSFGQGWRAGIAGGYTISKNLSFELAVNYFQSEEKRMTRQYIRDFDRSAVALNLEARGKVNAFDVAPSVVFWLGNEGAFKPYARIGAIVPVYGRLKITTKVIDKYGLTRAEQNASSPVDITNINLEQKDEISPRATVGFTGALGFKTALRERVSLFAEVEYRNISVSSKEKEVTGYSGTATATSGAGSQTVALTLDGLSYAERHTRYEDTIGTNSNVEGEGGTYTDPNRESTDLRSYINIGGLGLNVGVILTLHK